MYRRLRRLRGHDVLLWAAEAWIQDELLGLVVEVKAKV